MEKPKREQSIFYYQTRAEAEIKYDELKHCALFYDESRRCFVISTKRVKQLNYLKGK